jgi:hypothetical protein
MAGPWFDAAEDAFSIRFSYGWDSELARMNENKKGKPFAFPDSFVLIVGCVRVYFHLPSRQTEGLIMTTGKSLPNHPGYGHLCKRTNGWMLTSPVVSGQMMGW